MTVKISQKEYELALAHGQQKLSQNPVQAVRYLAIERLIIPLNAARKAPPLPNVTLRERK